MIPAACAKCDIRRGPSSGLGQCGRCRLVGYCGKVCQVADWPRHKRACRLLRGLVPNRGDPNLGGEVRTELYDGGDLGLGVRAARDIRPGEAVGYVCGLEVADVNAVATPRAFAYCYENVVSDPDDPESVRLGAADMMRVNDTMTPATFAALLSGDFREFAAGYVRDAATANVLALPAGPGVFRFVASRAIAVGQPLQYAYGAGHWLQLLAAGYLPGSRFGPAWDANRLLLQNPPWFAVASFGAEPARLAAAQRATVALDIVPFWLRPEGAEVVRCGVVGVDYFPVGGIAPGNAGALAHVVAPWAAAGWLGRDVNSPAGAESLLRAEAITVVLMGRGLLRLLPPAGDQSPETRREVSGARQRLVAAFVELYGQDSPLPAGLAAGILHDAADALLETLRQPTPA